MQRMTAESKAAGGYPQDSMATDLPLIGFSLFIACVMTLMLVEHPFATSQVALAGIAIVSIVRWPILGITVIFFLGPLGELQHFESGSSLVQIITLLLGVGLLVGLVTRRMSLRRTGLELRVVAFMLVYFIGAARDAIDPQKLIGLLTMLGYPVMFILVLNLVRTRRHVGWVVGALAIATTLAAGTSILEELVGFDPLVLLRGLEPVATAEVGPGLNRVLGFALDSNAAAYPFLISIPLFIAAAIVTRNRWFRGALVAVTCSATLGLVFTFSRSAYIAISIGLMFLLLNLERRKSLRVVAAVFVFVALLFYVLPEGSLTARFEEVPEQVGTMTDRWAHYQIAASQLLRNPLFGGGIELFRSEFEARFGSSGIAHSNLLDVAVNSGAVGLAALLSMLVPYFRFVRRGIAIMPWSPLRYYAIGSCAGLVAFLVQGFFMVNMGWFLLWAMAAIPLCCIVATDEDSASRSGPRLSPTLTAADAAPQSQ